MIGGPYQGAPDTRPSLHGNQGQSPDLSTLITVLITEIRSTLNTRIDILNEKIDMKNEENENLKQEVRKLKKVISEQEETIADLRAKSKSTPSTNDCPSVNTPAIQTIQQPQTKVRGIKAHNLIVTCPKIHETEPRKIVEDLFMTKFHRKPAINAVQMFNTRGSNSADIVAMPDADTRDVQTINASGATSGQSENVKILVTFNSIWETRAIYRERVQALRNTGIYISEDLGREEAQLFYMARQLKRRKMIINAWTEDGAVYIKEYNTSIPRALYATDPVLNKLNENIQVEENGSYKKGENNASGQNTARKESEVEEQQRTKETQEEALKEEDVSSGESSEEVEVIKKKKKSQKTRSTRQNKN